MQLAFTRLAIVNRSEAAMRLINAAQDLRHEYGFGLSTIALFTDPDRSSMFVRQADESVCLGPATFVDPKDGQRKSKYLDYDAVEQALLRCRADAAWVGWGFVAEHADFADLCQRLGVIFVGPNGAAMRRVADKIASKLLAQAADVPVVPWSEGPVETLTVARTHAERLGFPLMVKASGGGGGRGVRRVRSSEDLEEALASAQAESHKYFGSTTVFLERAVENARHVEVQVLADHHETYWALGVRDCTLQRRNQKVVEEAPLPTNDPTLEHDLRAAALRVARAARYRNAGTVEFLFDPRTREFFFMEMNARLQVEHPVTELTTGVDLVKMQLFVASGGALEQEPPATAGHAIEVRLNAEDPDNQFAPAPGRVELLRLPTGFGVRVDTGVAEGDTIASEFDSMIAKIVAFGRDRREALGRLRRALSQTVVLVRGGATNKAFLLDLLSNPDVVAGHTDTGWLDCNATSRQTAAGTHADIALIQAAVDMYGHAFAQETRAFFASASRGRVTIRTELGLDVDLRYRGHTYRLQARRVGPDEYRLSLGAESVDVRVDRQGDFERWLTCNGERYHVVSVVDGASHRVEVDGVPYRVSHDDGGVIRAPAPAAVLSIQVQNGDRVRPGDLLLVLEAMKTETRVVSPCAGWVRQVTVRPNAQVAAGAPVLVLEPADENGDGIHEGRIGFSASLAPRTDATPATYESALQEVRRLFLGYDIDSTESTLLLRAWDREHAVDDNARRAEEELLVIFADTADVFDEESERGFEQRMTAEESLHAYLRSMHVGSQRLAADFAEKLRRALRHHGADNLEPTPALEEALLRLCKAHHRRSDCASHLCRLLQRWLASTDAPAGKATPALRELLDRVIAATQAGALALNDLARRARFQFFDRPLFEAARAEAHGQVTQTFRRIVGTGSAEEYAYLMDAIVQCAHPLQGLLVSLCAEHDAALQRFGLQATFLRFYRLGELEQVSLEESHEHVVISANHHQHGQLTHRVATHGAYCDLGHALRAVAPIVGRYPASEPVSLDLYLGGPTGDASEVHGAIAPALALARLPRRLAYASVILAGPGPDKPSQSFTLVSGAEGTYQPHAVHPYMHPMVAERLEVWRLANFKIRQLTAPEHVYLFHAVARSNPRDERLFALVDVHDTTPLLDDTGAVLGLPYLEHLYYRAVSAIRGSQGSRAGRDRLECNRVALNLWSVTELTPAEIVRAVKRLAPAARGAGVEKTVVRVRVRDDATGDLVDRVLVASDRSGTGLRLHFDVPSSEPIQALTPYAQRVVQLQRLGLVYPYEIIRMLTPSMHDEHSEFPRGDFTEYDLGPDGKLVPVSRDHGLNGANVVVGVIRNSTPKHPEGMVRVMVLGDASREMGALSGPECARIVAALDLAEELGVPVDWFPVSSGAKIAMDVGTEGLDAVARVVRRIVEFTQAGAEINVVVGGVNVGGQSYWNAEATMLMHTKGILVMTPQGSMVLTGKRALDYSGGVSAETNQGIGGFGRIMGPNGQAQYCAQNVAEACHLLLQHYEHAYVAPGERFPRRARTRDPVNRNICVELHSTPEGSEFESVGDVFSKEKNLARKKPFDIRSVMRAVVDQDQRPLERWLFMHDAETAVTWDAHVGGFPVCLIGVESKPLPRLGIVPPDGPETWTGGTLFPQSSKKVARAINAANGNRPVVVLANLSGFDGSPESMRKLQLEYGAEIARAVVNFDGPIVFCVVSRYHGGAYVVFSRSLNEHLEVAALEGSYASVIGGGPAAAVVFPGEVKARTLSDPHLCELQAELSRASDPEKADLLARYDELYHRVYSEKRGEVAAYFDAIHSIERAKAVGSLDHIVPPAELRPYLVAALERGMERVLRDWTGARR